MNLKDSKKPVAWVQLGYMALSFALSYIAGRLLAKKSGLKVDDDKPTTLTTRGSYCNYLIGRRRLGPALVWAGDREIKKEKAAGGKGGGSDQKTDVYYEAGWHILCSNGPAWALHAIIQGGKVIFAGPITRDSHPSGSTVDLGKEGAFTIYWGEQTQPVNSFLGNVDRVGIASRWPFFCYIVWNKKRLGGSPQWPVLDYILDRRIIGTTLTDSQSYYDPTLSLTGSSGTVIGHANGAEGTGYLYFVGDMTQEFRNGEPVHLTGNSMPDGDYDVKLSSTERVVIGTNYWGFPIYATRTKVFLYGGVSGANDVGTLQAYEEAEDDGLNPAHIVADMLYQSWPQGIGLDPTFAPEEWDLDAHEAWGVDAETDGLRSSYIGTNGEKASSALAAFMQDYGVLAPIDTDTGKIRFYLVREPTGTLPNLQISANLSGLPEIENNLGERAVDKLIFKFNDREHSYGDMTIGLDDDGQASYEENQRSRVVELPTVINFASAAIISERRSQEELAGAATYSLNAARGARNLIPGQAITADGFDEILRVTGIEFDPLSSAVKLKAIVDYYGARQSDFETEQGGGIPVYEPVEPDLQSEIVEVPEYLLDSSDMTIIIPRIRAHDQILSADLWISRDDTSYTLNGTEMNVQTGGTLSVQLSATDPMYMPLGVTIDALGPDIATILDLSADHTNWMLGRQLCVISSSAGVELCFVQSATALGGSSYRLNGLVRGRYDSIRLTHPIGAKVFVFENTAIEDIQDILLVPEEDLYAKTQPNGTAGQLALSAVNPLAVTLHGKGIKPMDPIALYVTAPDKYVPVYHTAGNISFKWGYRSTASPKTGAGLQSSGAVCATSALQGIFNIEFLTSGDVLKLAVAQTATTYTLTNAALVAAFGSEPTTFKVRITLTNGGFTSDPITLTITKV